MAAGSNSQSRPKVPFFQWIIGGVILLVVALAIVPVFTRDRFIGERQSPVLQIARSIDLAMFAYAMDHNGSYPTGKSSTEVFQQLIDNNYISDPTIFWDESMKISGKIKPTSNKLKPENVCWDITASLSTNSPDEVPVVFLTGYKINYTPGGNAVPLFKLSDGRGLGLAVTYHNNSARFMVNNLPDGTITNFISTTFDPAGKKYQQLTPDGPLAP